VGDVFENHCFADAVGADENGIVSGLEEAEGEELVDGLAVDLLGPGPVEVGHGLEGGDACASKAPLEAAFFALALLDGEDLMEPRLVGDLLPTTDETKEAEGFETSLELDGSEIGHEDFSVFKAS
jgi:hypothetical protein